MTFKHTISLVLLLLFSTVVIQAKDLLGVPKMLLNPEDKIDLLERVNTKKMSNLSKEHPWVVFSDRAGNVTSKGEKLAFGENFYVLNQDATRVEIGTASIEDRLKARKIKSKGWIEKSKLLLWGNSLRKKSSYIKLKAFVLYKAEDVGAIYKGKKKLIEIYSGPRTKNTLDPIRVYDFYFVHKKKEIEY